MFDPASQQLQAEPLVPIRFEWRYGGHSVHLCGSFTRWLETVPMALDHGSAHQVYAVVCNLPPGVHQYKFIVDGEWRHDEGQPYMPDPLGNVNNWIFVQPPGAPPTVAGAASAASTVVASPAAQEQGGQAAMAMAAGGVKGGGEGAQQSSGMDWTSDAPPAPTAGAPVDGAPAEPDTSVPPPGECDPELTRARLLEFLHRHTAYELIPESGKVVVLDTALPVQQAFHALYEQGRASAPLWDQGRADFVGIVSASDFITILHRLRHRTPALSAAELEQLTLARWRHEMQLDKKPLVLARPEDSLHSVATSLLGCGYKSVPIVTYSFPTGDHSAAGEGGADGQPKGPTMGRQVAQLLHLSTLGGVLAAVARHFRYTPAALPLLSQPLSALRLGTFLPGTLPGGGLSHARAPASMDGTPTASGEGRVGGQGEGGPNAGKTEGTLHTIAPTAPLTEAMAKLLQLGVAALPVVDSAGALIDVYARSDVVALARDQAYSRLPLDEISVSQALAYCNAPSSSISCGAGGSSRTPPQPPSQPPNQSPTPECVGRLGRVFTCTRATSLRVVIEALACPQVRRLICVDPASNRVQGIVSLRDVTSYLFAQTN